MTKIAWRLDSIDKSEFDEMPNVEEQKYLIRDTNGAWHGGCSWTQSDQFKKDRRCFEYNRGAAYGDYIHIDEVSEIYLLPT